MSTNENGECQSRILLADDDPVLRELAEANLVAAGYHVSVARDGVEALSILEHLEVDLVVTDLEMPKLDGIALTEKIRSTPEFRHLPIIVITGKSQEEAVDNAFAAGATSFLAKPLNWQLFTRSIRFVLQAAQMEQELRLAQQKAEMAARLKQAILANMSHEFRTPLNHIIGFGDLLADKITASDAAQSRDYGEYIAQSGRRLLNLVNDMMFLSDAESRGVRMDKSDTSPQYVIDEAVEACRSRAAEKSIKLNVVGAKALQSFQADQLLLVRAMEKLVDNAIKFSDPGAEITLGCTLEGPVERLIFFVRDNGPGMTDKHISRAGKLFHQEQMGWDRQHEGIGAGLRICRLITEAHGGKLRLANNAGKGLTAMLEFPVQERIAA